jgi:lambda family phage tail tape measure protein
MANLGTLTLSLIAEIGGYTAGLTKAERAAQKSSKAIVAEFDGMVKGSALAFTALTGTAAAAFAAISAQAESIASFQGLAEKVGDTAEAISSLKLASDVSGVSMETIAAASIRLTASLSKADEEGQGAAAAIKALGFEFESFKKMAPVEQLDAVARSLAGFEDGSSKTAVAVALLGKSGAELLPFFNDLANGSERFTRLTKSAIEEADLFTKSTARLKSEIQSLTQFYAGPAISGLNALIAKLKEGQVQSETLTERFYRQAAAARAMLGIGTIQNPYADTRKDLENVDARLKNVNLGEAKRNELLQERNRLEEKRQQYLTGTRMTSATDPRSLGLPQLDFDNRKPDKAPKAPKDNGAEQEARAKLAFDLDAIRNSMQAFRDLYGNNEKLLEAMRSAGLVEESDYYRQKRDFLEKNTAAQIDAQQQTIARLKLDELSGAADINRSKQVADAEAALAKIRADSATQLKVLNIEADSASNRTLSSLLSARQAAQSFFDTTKKGYNTMLAGLGQGNKFREEMAGLQAINEKFEAQRQELQNSRAQAELSGPLGPQAEKQYADQLALIGEFQGKAIQSYRDYYAQLTLAQQDWSKGASEAIRNYVDEAAKSANIVQGIFTDSFRGLENELTNLFTGGKSDFTSLGKQIHAGITRGLVQQNIVAPFAKFLEDGMKSGEGAGGWLKDLMGGLFPKPEGIGSLLTGAGPAPAAMGFLATSANAAAAALSQLSVSAGGQAVTGGGGGLFGGLFGGLGKFFSGLSGNGGFGTGAAFGNMDFGGFFAEGGHLGAGKWGIAGENGPELIRGPAHVVPASQTMNRNISIVQNISVPPTTSRITASQFATETMRRAQQASNRNG